MAGKLNDKLFLIGLMVLSFSVGVTAAPKTSKDVGFNDYGYNLNALIFNGCYTNYMNYAYNRDAVTCPEDDWELLLKWHKDDEGANDWFMNVWTAPEGTIYFYKVVRTPWSICDANGGERQTFYGQEWCLIMNVTSGIGATTIATPPGLGYYTQ